MHCEACLALELKLCNKVGFYGAAQSYRRFLIQNGTETKDISSSLWIVPNICIKSWRFLWRAIKTSLEILK